MAFVQLLHQLGQRLMNLLLIAGLQQIMPHSVLHRTAGIIEILVSGQHYNLDPGIPNTATLHKPKPIQPGHGNISDYNVRAKPLDLFQRLDPVSCRTRQLRARPGPIHHFGNPFQNQALIIYHQ
ncbi:hypothetical protein D3C81_1987360 [compost metagenome]